jgi:hypothetical protein
MNIKHITWHEAQYSQFWGTINGDTKLTVGSVGYTGNAGTPWVARFSALGFVVVNVYKTLDEAKEAVQDSLELFLYQLID